MEVARWRAPSRRLQQVGLALDVAAPHATVPELAHHGVVVVPAVASLRLGGCNWRYMLLLLLLLLLLGVAVAAGVAAAGVAVSLTVVAAVCVQRPANAVRPAPHDRVERCGVNAR